MKIGTEQVKRKIMNKLKKHKATLRDIGYGEFSQELAEEVISLFGDDMNTEWMVAHDFKPEYEEIAKRLEKGLSMNLFKRTSAAAVVYQWLIEQEQQGKKIETFCHWAMNPSRREYVGKYRSKPENIMADFPLAFVGNTSGRAAMLESIND